MAETPVFIKIDNYEEVLDIIQLTKSKIKEARAIIVKINELKNREDTELDAWQNSLDDIEKRVIHIDRTLYEPETVG